MISIEHLHLKFDLLVTLLKFFVMTWEENSKVFRLYKLGMDILVIMVDISYSQYKWNYSYRFENRY